MIYVFIYFFFRCATPQMRPFIYGSRFNTSIIDLNETTILLRQALNFLAHVAYRGIVYVPKVARSS